MKTKYYWWGVGGVMVLVVGLLSIGSVLEARSTGQEDTCKSISARQESPPNECLLVQVENDRLVREIAQVRKQLEALQSSPHVRLFHASRQLRDKGLNDPVGDLINDLKQHVALIPMTGTLGGTMRFHNETSWVITDKWVLAHFDDGHKGGTMLLEYTVENGAIQWTVVDVAPH